MLTISDIKLGTVVQHKSEPYTTVSAQHLKMGRGGAVLKTKLKNLINGNVLEVTFKGSDKIEEANLARRKANFLYPENDNYFFMDNESYDQFFLTKEQLTNKEKYLKEGLTVDVLYFNNNPVSIALPVKINLQVKSAPPGVRGDSAQGRVTKRVVLENDLEVDTPLFIKEGDAVIINTETGEYVERA